MDSFWGHYVSYSIPFYPLSWIPGASFCLRFIFLSVQPGSCIKVFFPTLSNIFMVKKKSSHPLPTLVSLPLNIHTPGSKSTKSAASLPRAVAAPHLLDM